MNPKEGAVNPKPKGHNPAGGDDRTQRVNLIGRPAEDKRISTAHAQIDPVPNAGPMRRTSGPGTRG